MRKVSFGLGLAGGILGVIQGIGGLLTTLFINWFDFPFDHSNRFFDVFDKSDFVFDRVIDFGEKFWIYMLPSSLALIAAGILGIIGSTLVSKNNKTAGVLMLVGGGLCVIGNFHTLVAGLLIAAGILALVKPKQQPTQAQ